MAQAPTAAPGSWGTYRQLAGSRLPAHAPAVPRTRPAQYGGVHSAFWLRAAQIAARHSCMARQAVAQAELEAETSSGIDVGLTDLLIVGPGVLGARLGQLWLQEHPQALVTAQTNTSHNHERLRQLGLTPCTKAEAGRRSCSNVVFSAPPSGSDDYVAEVRSALKQWTGTGTFVFTSSIGVYSEDQGATGTEDSATFPLGSSPRLDKLLRAEEAVLAAGGNVVRLAGLYHANRGAHTHFLRMGKVERWGGTVLNLLHYEDAASLCLAVLQHGQQEQQLRARTFLGCDNAPITFQEMMDATAASGKYEGSVQFTGSEGPGKGKVLDNSASRAALSWQPQYASYQQFMSRGAVDVYSLEAPLQGLGLKHG